MNRNNLSIDLPLVNCHCHAPMVAFRGLGTDRSLQQWLEDYIWPAERANVSRKMVEEQSKKAIKEMKKNKISAFVDMYFFEDKVAEEAIKENMNVIIGEGLLDFPSPSYKTFEEWLEITLDLIKKYKNNPLVRVSVAPHSIYTVNSKHLVDAKKIARKYGLIYQIHCAETKKEFNDCLKKYNKTPVQYLDSLGVLDERTLLAHCVWVNDKDIEIISKRKSVVVYCPLSNSKLGSGIAPIPRMLERNILVCLGTDGAASSDRLDIWEAGKYGALIQKAINQDATILPVKEVIKMMTINGMRALKIDSLNGKNAKEWEAVIDNENFSHLYSFNFD